MTNLLLRSTVIWLAILVVAIANGAFRQVVLIPRLGDLPGHVISTLALSAAVFLVTWIALGWIHPAAPGELWIVGGYWLLATAAFEFLGGHFLFGRPWEVLLADYRIQDGRIWMLVLVSTFLAPFVMGRLKGI